MTCVIPNAAWSHVDEAYLCKRCGGILGRTHDAVHVCDCDRPVAELQDAAAPLLRNLMEDISERCYCAGWLLGLEYALYGIAFEARPKRFGQDDVTDDEAIELRRLAQASDSWWHWPDGVDDGPVRITLQRAKELYASERGT